MVEHAVGFILLPVLNASGSECSMTLVTARQMGWRSHILATSADAPHEQLELELADASSKAVLHAAGRVVREHKLPHQLRLLPAANPAAAGAGTAPAAQHCVQLIIGMNNMLLQGFGWKRSNEAALLFKQLLPMDTDLDAAVHRILQGPVAATPPQQQQQQQQHQSASYAAGPSPGRYTLLSCFRELPSVSTAPPPTAISIAAECQRYHQHRQQQQQDEKEQVADLQHDQQQQQQEAVQLQETAAAAAVAARSGSSLADVPPAVMQQLLGLLSASDLASLACCCKGLRSVTWEAVPGMKLILYPHQRNALSWMLHREVHGGQEMRHPFIMKYVTDSGIPLYLNQVTGELLADPPPPIHDIRGGFFCDEPGLGKTVTALSLILKTQGITPSPPPGSHVTWLHTPTGRKVGFYTHGLDPSLQSNSQHTHTNGGLSLQQQQQQQQQCDVAPGITNLGRSGSLRRSGSYSGSGGSFSSLKGFSNARKQVQQGAWALAPSLRSSRSRRRARSEAAAAEVAAAAAAAAAADDERLDKGSSRKRKLPPLPNKPQQQQQQQQDVCEVLLPPGQGAGSSISRSRSSTPTRAATIEVVAPDALQAPPPSVAAAAVPAAAMHNASAGATGVAAATPTPCVPARAAAANAAAKIHNLVSVEHPHAEQQQQQQQGQREQQQQQLGTALGSKADTAKNMLHQAFGDFPPESQPKQQRSRSQHIAPAAAAGVGSGGIAQDAMVSPRRRAALKAASSIQQLYADTAQDNTSSEEHAVPAAAPAAASAAAAAAAAGGSKGPCKQIRSSRRPKSPAVAAADAAGSSRRGSRDRNKIKDYIITTDSGTESEADKSADTSDYEATNTDDDIDSESDYSQEIMHSRRASSGRRSSSAGSRQQQQGRSRAASKPQQQHLQQHQQGSVCSGSGQLQLASAAAATVAAEQHVEQQPAKRQKCEQQQQQDQQQQQGTTACSCDDSAVAAAGDADFNWVMCDHCSKWRTLPQGHKVDSDTPWFCCLHPNPDLASCLIPEEQHDGNNMSYNIDKDGNEMYSYKSMPGFISAESETPSDKCDSHVTPAEKNVAHFAAVINQANDVGDVDWIQQLLWWLAGQSPEALLTIGVTVPREIVKHLPDYGCIMSLMSLQCKKPATTVAKRRPSSNAKKPRTPAKAAAAAAGGQTAQQQQLTAAAAAVGNRNASADSDDDYDPAAATPAAAAPAAATPAAAGSSRKAGSSSNRGGYSAAAHTWIQPPACDALRFDVAALRAALEQGAAGGTRPRMFLSSATLVIVPVTLIPHWQQQIRQHLLPKRLRVIVLGAATAIAAGTDPAAVGCSSRAGSSVKASSSTAAGGGGAAESVCPPAHELAWNYDVVITTFNRLSSDWSMRGNPRLADRMVLLKVHWLRILIDEGHSLGASLGLTNKLAMAVQLTAQRRWVMTGTPTPATAAGSGAAHLQPLLSFLHHQPFGSIRKSWEGAVAKPLEAAAAAAAAGSASSSKGLGPGASVLDAEWGRQQLLNLLSRVMIRSCKADLALLPPCYKKVTLLDFGADHAHSYNALIEVIRRNLLLADWCDDAHVESLLNPKQGQWAKEMLSNVRLACCVAGVMNLVPNDADVLETLELLAGKLELPQPAKEQHIIPVRDPAPTPAAAAADDGDGPAAAAASEQQQQQQVDVSGVVLRQRWFYTGPGHPLHRIEDALRNGCKCQVCGDTTHVPLVTPCAHLLCTDCTAVSRTACPVPTCRAPYEMQAMDDPSRYANNPKPKWEVPLNLIEWQPVYHQAGATGVSGGQWSANWRITRSTKVLHLLKRLTEIGIYTPPNRHTAATAAAAAAAAAKQAGSYTAAAGDGLYKSCLKGSTTAAAANPTAASSSSGQQIVKAIVFSQFWMHIQLIAAELGARGVRHVFLKKDMPARDKQAAVTAFRASPHSNCLVMDESGALGLDLSFVRYIFLMEPIADAALEQQVVSRAHRMGATAAVHVEVLAMRHTAEEHLVALRHQAASGKLSSSAADVAASHAAATVAGTIQQQLLLPDLQQQQQSDTRQQQQQQEEELGGSSAAAAAVDVANISNFISVGGGGNQMDNRGLRNLLLLHLRKVVVAELPELPEHLDDSPTAAAAAGFDDWGDKHIGWRGGRGNLLQAEDNAGCTAAAAAAGGIRAAAIPVVTGGGRLRSSSGGGGGSSTVLRVPPANTLWGDFAVRQQQQRQRWSEPLEIGEEDEEMPDLSQQQQQQACQLLPEQAVPVQSEQPEQQQQQQQHSSRPRVQFAGVDGQIVTQSAAAAAAGDYCLGSRAAGAGALSGAAPAAAPKPVKRARFADDV